MLRLNKMKQTVSIQQKPAPDLDGWRPGAQAWWEAPCGDTKSLGRWWSMKSILFPRII